MEVLHLKCLPADLSVGAYCGCPNDDGAGVGNSLKLEVLEGFLGDGLSGEGLP